MSFVIHQRQCFSCGKSVPAYDFCPTCLEPPPDRSGRSILNTFVHGVPHLDPIDEALPHEHVERRVCARCGVVALAGRATCDGCHGKLSRTVPSAPGLWQAWVRFEGTFRCACGPDAPLGISPELRATCARCDVPVPLSQEQHDRLFGALADVADLAGPHPEGSIPLPGIAIAPANPYRDLGVTRASCSIALEADDLDLAVRAFPGHPWCPRCPTALVLEDRAVNAVEPVVATCASCGFRAEAPPAASPLWAVFVLAAPPEARASYREAPRADWTWLCFRTPSRLREPLVWDDYLRRKRAWLRDPSLPRRRARANERSARGSWAAFFVGFAIAVAVFAGVAAIVLLVR